MNRDNPLRKTHRINIPLALLIAFLFIIAFSRVTYKKVSTFDDVPSLNPQTQWGKYQKAWFLAASQYLIKQRTVEGISIAGTVNYKDLNDFATYYIGELIKRGWKKTHQVENDKSGAGVYLFSKVDGLSPDIISRFFFYLKVYGYYLLSKPLPFKERYFEINYDKPSFYPGKFEVEIQYTDYINHPQ